MKFLIVAIVAVMVAISIFGFSNISAEPTIEDLAAPFVQQMGTFEPDSLLENNETFNQNFDYEWVGTLETTQLYFSHDVWKDTSGDGVIDVEDVYSVEGFESDLLMEEVVYQIIDIDPNSNYYVVHYPDFELYNGVIIDAMLSDNSDDARMTDEKFYWFDANTNCFYISKELIGEDLENGAFNSLRAETITLVKDVASMEKQIDVFSVFSAEINDWHGLDKVTPNKTMSFNVLDSAAGGLQVSLAPAEYLAYISHENLEVYVNHTKISGWIYNDVNGILTINDSPFTTRSITIKFTDVETPSKTEQLLQSIQTNDETGVAGTTLEQSLDGDNPFLTYLQYTTEAPKVGETQQLEYTGFVSIDHNKKEVLRVGQQAFHISVPEDTVRKVINEYVQTHAPITDKNGHTVWTSDTLTAYQGMATGVIEGRDERVAQIYGYVTLNMFMNYKYNAGMNMDSNYYDSNGDGVAEWHDNKQTISATDAIKWAIADIEGWLLWQPNDNITNVDTVGSYGYALTKVWMAGDWAKANMKDTDGDGKGDTLQYYGRYITGSTKDTFLGGTVPDSAHVMFDVICARMESPNLDYIKQMQDAFGANSSQKGNYDYRANATIIKKTSQQVTLSDGSVADGYLYICVWSQTMQDASDTDHSQRILAFSRVPYKYHGTGYIQLSKENMDGQLVAGAVYGVYDELGNEVTRMTTENAAVTSCELPIGTYTIKEISTPAGYLLDTQSYTVVVESGKTTEKTVIDQYQMCKFEVTVYDETTKGDSVEVPVPGIKFKLYSPGGEEVGEYTTGPDGKISGSIRTAGDADNPYYLIQTSTVTNYAMTLDEKSWDYCKRIPIIATPTSSGSNTQYQTKHYEHRQTVSIISHVQDVNLGSSTPAILGGDKSYNSYVSTLNAKYTLTNKEKILLGYIDGDPVEVAPGTQLEVGDWILNNSGSTQSTSQQVVSKQTSEKAYLTATVIKYQNNYYPIPNGEYIWTMTAASPGYWMNGKTTDVDATWESLNPEVINEQVIEYPVQQTRQTAEIEFYVKFYTDDKRNVEINKNFTNIIQTKLPSLVSSICKPTDVNYNNYTKDITSNLSKISVKSKEQIVVSDSSGKIKQSIIAEGLAPNAVYELYNISDIVDINTGEIISGMKADGGITQQPQLLGYYLTDANGAITITQMGTDGFDNPNTESSASTPKFNRVDPKTDAGTSVSGHDLPNGEYALLLRVVGDGYHKEDIIADGRTGIDLQWTNGESENKHSQVLVALRKQPDPIPEPPMLEVVVAPDAPIADPEGDNKDPQNPESDRIGVDETGEIVAKDWVDKNKKNISYRIVDPSNLDGNSSDAAHEVNDTLPTSFAFYFKNTQNKDSTINYTYNLSFYYEIDAQAFAEASDEQKNNYEYIEKNGNYYRRFSTDLLQGGDDLSDVIQFNVNSEGYVNNNQALDNGVITGMIYNTEWINEKLLSQMDGDGKYTILVSIDIVSEDSIMFSRFPIINYHTNRFYGTLTIRNRNLVNLD